MDRYDDEEFHIPLRRIRRIHCARQDKYQARFWVPNVGLINLGLYPTAKAATMAIKRFVQTGQLPETVLPRYVRRYGDGRFYARVVKWGRRFSLAGPFDTAEAANEAMEERLREHAAQREMVGMAG